MQNRMNDSHWNGGKNECTVYTTEDVCIILRAKNIQTTFETHQPNNKCSSLKFLKPSARFFGIIFGGPTKLRRYFK